MDYEKKYKEALERAKEIIECSKPDTKEVRMVLSFFPELKGNKDEQMRKKCIDLIKELKTFCLRDGQDECIAWLEKQGNQKPVEWSDTDLISLGYLADFVDKNGDEFYGTNKPNVVKWIHSFANLTTPQQEWSEEDKNLLRLSVENLTELKDRFGKEYGRTGDCIDWLKSLKPNHWKPSREQMKALKFCIKYNIDNEGIFGSKLVKLFNELEKL